VIDIDRCFSFRKRQTQIELWLSRLSYQRSSFKVIYRVISSCAILLDWQIAFKMFDKRWPLSKRKSTLTSSMQFTELYNSNKCVFCHSTYLLVNLLYLTGLRMDSLSASCIILFVMGMGTSGKICFHWCHNELFCVLIHYL